MAYISPDLNPIENIWGIMIEKIKKEKYFSTIRVN